VQMKRWKVELEDPAPKRVEVVENAGGEWLAPVFDEKEVLRQWEAERAAWHAARDQERAAEAAAKAAAECAGEKPAEAGSAPEHASPAVETVPESGAAESLAERAGGSARGSTATENTTVSGSESGTGEGEPAISYAEWASMRLDQLPQERRDANDPPEPDALWLPNSTAQFRDLKKNWDMALNRAEKERGDMYFKRYGETREDFLEARQRPYEAYFEKQGDRG
ncbi:MAG TPA: hypothetical protein VJS11_07530, partial [Acidobacteriaceae bacterium]|nr:hypothetical protein [Acidobacteriaceae bacterium]